MKVECVHKMVGGDILLQGGLIGAEHLLRAVGADAPLSGAAGVKQQRSTWRNADIAYRKEHGAGRLTVAVNAKALTRCVILLYHGLELRKLGWIARTVAHAQGRHGSIGIGRLPREATERVQKCKRPQCAHWFPPSMRNALHSCPQGSECGNLAAGLGRWKPLGPVVGNNLRHVRSHTGHSRRIGHAHDMSGQEDNLGNEVSRLVYSPGEPKAIPDPGSVPARD
jgi:hypothetical protein